MIGGFRDRRKAAGVARRDCAANVPVDTAGVDTERGSRGATVAWLARSTPGRECWEDSAPRYQRPTTRSASTEAPRGAIW